MAIYLIVFASLVVIGARLGDVLGRRRAFIAGLAGFTLASLAAGLAPTPTLLILARALQGAAAALMTPQVLAMIQIHFTGEARARAIGAYSLILAVGVAAGQVVGGLVIGAHLLPGIWRPALLLNVPVGVAVLAAARRGLPATAPVSPPTPAPGPAAPRRFDLAGAVLIAAALLAVVAPLTVGRQAGWPWWVWPSLAACPAIAWRFARTERRMLKRGRQPLFDLGVLTLPGVAAGVLAVVLLMGSYAGFLLSLTLHLQGALRFSPQHAGLVFGVYASGFAAASLTWTRLGTVARERLPVAGPLLMAAALLGVGLIADRGGWPAIGCSLLLFAGGAGHACGYSPLANRLTTLVPQRLVTELSGLLMIAALTGSILGVAALAGLYLGQSGHGSGYALELVTLAALAPLLVACACAARALAFGRATEAAAVPAPAES